MSALANENTKVICQDLTSSPGTFHSQQATDYGTKMVGDMMLSKDRQMHLVLPVFATAPWASNVMQPSACVTHLPPASQLTRRKALL